eukprot:gnl/TRDRNA2_/TRDRNA2_175015_c1_seq17.p2 gnl/TRDRNA2_/TRDRNA2_175015_c1~~gnl/TRDRNA2_/TRDRNA2_175015_c1_seq17.p2  ORF type:complete len:128 (-),score=40.13 gnl/TRDRNA2_/TRDRNA2_175015_c1_seq17:105-488(-)
MLARYVLLLALVAVAGAHSSTKSREGFMAVKDGERESEDAVQKMPETLEERVARERESLHHMHVGAAFAVLEKRSKAALEAERAFVLKDQALDYNYAQEQTNGHAHAARAAAAAAAEEPRAAGRQQH